MKGDILPKGYEPESVEDKWYKFWEENGLFKSDPSSGKEPFCIVIPPPNVTGTLHMGHALNNTLQDILCRYKRMKGYDVLWQPGTDHAGIATQNVVERELSSKGLDRHTIGREKFIEKVWEWKERYGGFIIKQLKKLGSSCDWSRERFTMDEGLSRAVREVFVRLYEEGLIYRGNYIINWCPRCMTALADLEVEHYERDSFLYYIRYPFEGKDGYITVATTRPETLLGDTAVAVNPEDKRYQGLSGMRVLLPVLKRPIPIIYDSYVDMEFGTGALKITPAHDVNDFEIGNRHGLDMVKVIDDSGRMNELAGPYKGMDRFECREKILIDLEKDGLLEKTESYRHAVGHCYRCKTMIEPILSKQWFVNVGPLAEKAVRAVKEGKTRIIPEQWTNVFFEWMDNIRDWCISRQIWWGHRIPVWYCKSCDEIIVSRDEPEVCKKCGGTQLEMENDVLDTWFSSALWPFSTLGWPDQTPELKRFYPTSVLVTGFDILFFWVARMMMMGIHFIGDVPFRDVYIHALVRDAEGKKMSKSKGNVIDPLEIIEKYGTDAFRFTLASLAAQGRDIKLSEEKIQGYRHFVNKIWNSARFILMNMDGQTKGLQEGMSLTLPDRWLLSRLHILSKKVSSAIDNYLFNEAATLSYQFTWHEFCDWYIEMSKINLYGDDEVSKSSTRAILKEAFIALLKILHPFMPFVTEELWQRLTDEGKSIMIAPFPEPSEFPYDEGAMNQMELIMQIITGIRNIRGELNIPPSKKVNVVADIHDDQISTLIKENMGYIKALSKVESFEIKPGIEKPKYSATSVVGENEIHVLLEGILDPQEEIKRITKEIKRIQKDVEGDIRKLENRNFLEKAPDDVVEKVKNRVHELQIKKDRLENNLKFFQSIDD